jgi:hypothetical protein
VAGVPQIITNGAGIDAEVSKIMTHTHAKGMAVAVVDHGKLSYAEAYGIRNTKGHPLTTDTVMYGASLTKTVFAYTVGNWSIKANSSSTQLSRTILISRCRVTRRWILI